MCPKLGSFLELSNLLRQHCITKIAERVFLMKMLAGLIFFVLLMFPAVDLYGKNGADSGNSVEPEKIKAGAWRGTQLIGINVYGADGKRVASIADIVGDIKGQVVYVVLSVGGILGIGDKLIPLPWELLSPGGRPNTLKVNVSVDDLKKAPNFDSNNWPDLNQSEWKTKTQKYYQELGTKKKQKSK